MLLAFAYSLPMALGISLSPLPVVFSVSVLLSSRPANATAFSLGWAVGIFLIGFTVFLIPGLEAERGEPTLLAGGIRLILGAGLLFLAIRQWMKHLSGEGVSESPRLLNKLNDSTPGKTLVTGLMLSVFNPKNLLLTLAGVSYIDAYASSLAEQSLVLLFFTLVASAGVILPIIGYILFPARAQSFLAVTRSWLLRNNAAVVGSFLLALGVIIGASGLAILCSCL